MSAFNWTEEQKNAIQARDCNLLVAAAAGSGKTAVLVERIIRKVFDPDNETDIDRLVIVTFTSAAASEMRERIERAISERINNFTDKDDINLKKRLKRQLTLLSNANITTIHSFCKNIIKSNFNKINIDPDFRIIDEIEADILRGEIVEGIFEEIYNSSLSKESIIVEGIIEKSIIEKELFELLTDVYGDSRSDDGLKDLILSVYSYTNTCPFPEKWLEEQLFKFSPEEISQRGSDFRNTIWGEFIFHKLNNEIPELINSCEYAIRLCSSGGVYSYIDNFEKYSDFLKGLLSEVRNKDCRWDDMYSKLSLTEFKRFPGKTKDCNENIASRVLSVAEEIKSAIKAYSEVYFSKTSQENISDIQTVHNLLTGVCDLVLYFSKKYEENKRQKRIADYDDLEHLALRILTENPEVAEEFRDHYQEVYTDEYQDSNLTQETILSLISRHLPVTPNMFMVGDIKQSIYGFRQARPDIFLEKYNRYSETCYDKNKERLVRLFKNFRSRKDVIGSVNYIFSCIMTKEVCGMDYGREEYLNYGADYNDADWDVSCELLLTDSKSETEESRPDKMKIEFEAAMIAKRIRELTGDNSANLQYKDIVVLLRATRDKAQVYKDIFSAYGIPAFCDINSGFFQSREVKLIISFLKIIDNPIQDIPLLSVLKSPAAGFTENEIVDMRLPDRNVSVYQNLVELAGTSDETGKKAAVFLEKLSDLREDAVELPLSELILKLYRETDYFNYAGVFPDGEQRQANLRKFYSQAVNYEEQTGGGIFEFLYYVDKIKEGSGDVGGAAVLGENDNVVRIMSIHKSKGLEFPVVFIANMDKGFNRRDFSESILMHQDLGFAADCFDTELRIKYETITKTAMKLKLNSEMIAEEIRLLYVAMTRAREKLIMTGTIPGLSESFRKYSGIIPIGSRKLPSYYTLKAKSYFDFILPVLTRHPSMGALRDLAGIIPEDNEFIDIREGEECNFKCIIYDRNELSGETIQQELESTYCKGEATGDLIERAELFKEVGGRLSYEYPFEESVNLPVKVSVSELKGQSGLPQPVESPAFMAGKKQKTSAELGTVVHYIMQHINMDKISASEIKKLALERGLTDKEAGMINKSKILDFFSGGLGSRILKAEKVYREIPFTMKVNAKEIFSEINEENEMILVQGIVDCYFEEEGKIVLLDYKTDYVEPGMEEAAALKYKIQLDMYARAVADETGKEIKEKIIYFLNAGKYVKI